MTSTASPVRSPLVFCVFLALLFAGPAIAVGAGPGEHWQRRIPGWQAGQYLRPISVPALRERAATAVVDDGAGDVFGDLAVRHDVVRLSATSDGTVLTLVVDFVDDIAPGDRDDARAAVGVIDLDTDRDRSTGSAGTVGVLCPDAARMGVEFEIRLMDYDRRNGVAPVADADGLVGWAGVEFSARSISVEVPLIVLADDGIADIAGVFGTPSEATDCVPSGSVLTSDGPAALETRSLTGNTPNGAFYNIMAPPGWQPADGLVVYNHGFSLSPIHSPDLGPLASVQLAEGYAVAASSYSAPGWALFDIAEDLRQLLDVFETAFGTPEAILVNGPSLGGIVTAEAIEQGDLGNVVGAFPFCGAVAGSRVWDGGFDLRVLYDFVCGDVPGAAIPGGGSGLPMDSTLTEADVDRAIDVCTGVDRPSFLRTPEQAAKLDRLLTLARIPERFLLTDMGFATFGMRDLIYDPAKLDGRAALGNALVDYGDAEVNAGIERVAIDPSDRRFLLNHFTPRGLVGDIKIVSLHTDKDGLVIVENESAYAEVVPSQNLTIAVIKDLVPTHCVFTASEVLAGWEALRAWVAGAPQPTAAGIRDVCTALGSPCRIDPDFDIDDFDQRVRPRPGDRLPPSCTADDRTLCLSGGRFQVEVEWRDFQDRRGDGEVVPFGSDDSGLFWFFGPDNWEMLVKVLDKCGTKSDQFWVFAAATTDVEYTLQVTDTQTGAIKQYFNPLGTAAAAITDTSAFDCP